MQAPTILLVEDQLEFLAIHKLYLERHGYRVLTAEDGASGIRSAKRDQPDLILMDFSIPGMDGISAVRELKRDPKVQAIPVILLTAHAYGSVGRRAREAGCVGFISKPCEPRRVLQEVVQLIGPAAERVH